MWNNINLSGSKYIFQPDNDSNLLFNKLYSDLKNISNLKILDLGCGSGAIGLALLKQLNNCQLTGSDINSLAIQYANQNALNNNLLNYNFIESDMFNNIENKFDIIFTNIPFMNYIQAKELLFSKYIPITSLIVGNSVNEDILLNNLIQQSPNFLNNNGFLYFLTGDENQKNRMTQLLLQNNFTNIENFNTNKEKPLFIKAQYINNN